MEVRPPARRPFPNSSRCRWCTRMWQLRLLVSRLCRPPEAESPADSHYPIHRPNKREATHTVYCPRCGIRPIARPGFVRSLDLELRSESESWRLVRLMLMLV